MSEDDLTQYFTNLGKDMNVEVKDYGYPEIAIFDYCTGDSYRSPAYRYINIPTNLSSIIVPGPYGLEIGGNIDGITEVLTLTERNYLEICFINDLGELLDSNNVLLQKKIKKTMKLVRKNVEERNFEMCKWARSRLASIGFDYSVSLDLDDKIVDREDIYAAARTSATKWNLFATMLYTYESFSHTFYEWYRDCLNIFLTNNKKNIEMSFNSILIIGLLVRESGWNSIINRDDFTSLLIEEDEFIEALSELEKLGFVENPASVKSALNCVDMSKLRGKFSELGIKAQSKDLLIERAITNLGERGIKKLLENDDDIDFDIGIYTPKAFSFYSENRELDIIMGLIESRYVFGSYRNEYEKINFVMPFDIEIPEIEDDVYEWTDFEVRCRYCKKKFLNSNINEHQGQCEENPWKDSGLGEWIETCQKSIDQLSDLLNREDSELTNETKEYLIKYIHYLSGLFRSDWLE